VKAGYRRVEVCCGGCRNAASHADWISASKQTPAGRTCEIGRHGRLGGQARFESAPLLWTPPSDVHFAGVTIEISRDNRLILGCSEADRLVAHREDGVSAYWRFDNSLT
jgi:hypothetical protein